jgi:hypothetical protein
MIRKHIKTAAIIALLLALALVCRRNSSLNQEISYLRASPVTTTVKTNLKEDRLEATSDRDDRLQWRKEHLELLSLRGRVAVLSRELRERRDAQAQTGPLPALNSRTDDVDSILFSASQTNRVPEGNTLAIGGWPLNGMRGYLLLTPTLPPPDAPEAGKISINQRIVRAPESFWNQIGWADAKSDAHRSGLSVVLTPDQADTLMQAIEQTKGAEVSSASPALVRDGGRVGFAFSVSDENESGVLMSVEVYPRILSQDGSVELGIQPSELSEKDKNLVHPSLKRMALVHAQR